MGGINRDLREKHIIGPATQERIVGPQGVEALRGPGITLAGVSDTAWPFEFIRQAPPMLQVLACVAGRGRVLVEGRWQDCAAGQAYVTPPGPLHAYHAAKAGRWQVCWVMYRGEALAGRRLPTGPAVVRYDASALQGAVLGLHREATGPADAALLGHWAQIVHTLAMRALPGQPASDPLGHLWQAVSADLGRPWSLDDLADLSAMSGEHLRRLSLRHSGRSPLRQVAYLRMQRAAELLLGTSRKVSDIARAVGYDNAFAFATAFRRALGQAPSVFRQRRQPCP